MKPIRVLYIMGGVMNYGGTEAYIMNYYRNMDHDIVQFDFVYQGIGNGAYDKELKANGSKIFHVSNKLRHPILFTRELKSIFKDYKIIHSQMDAMGIWPLRIAKKMGIPVRIAHSHSTNHQTSNIIKYVFNEIARKLIKYYATECWACSKKAGQWLFGKKMCESGKVRIINNAVNLEKFKFDSEMRIEKRRELGVENCFVIGHVGAFRFEKNHEYLIDIIECIVKKKHDAKLILIGEGILEEKIKNIVKEKNLQRSVLFLGKQEDTSVYYNCLDAFVLPSLFEGLPVVIVEAQANGLPCYISKNVSEEAEITDLVVRLDIERSALEWSEIIIKTENKKRDEYVNEMIKHGYDIRTESIKLQSMYLELYNSV